MFRDGKYYCDYCGKEVTNRHPYYLGLRKSHFCNKEHFYLNKKGNEYILHDDYAEIVIKSKIYGIKSVKIDLEDVEKCKKYTWSLVYAKDRFYISNGSKKQKIYLHRYIMDCPSNMFVDHKNNDGLDNRKVNMQIVTRKENNENRKLAKNNKTGITGVHWNERMKRYVVRVHIDKKAKDWYCKTLIEAEQLVKELRNKYYTNNLIDRGLREK